MECVQNCDGLPKITQDCTLQETFSPLTSMRSAIESSPNPVPYTFRISAPNPRKGGCGVAQQAKAPPFYMQLDHTLAVLWCLFRKRANKNIGDECDVGVAQLQWALYFLKGIKPPNGGDHAKDVSIAIQVVQDALLELYADMATVVMQSPATLNSTGTSQVSCTLCDALKRGYTGNLSWMPEKPIASCNKCSSVTLGVHKGGGRARRSGKKGEDSLDPSFNKTTTFKNTPIKTKRDLIPKDEKLSEEIKELKKVAAELLKQTPDSPEKPGLEMLEELRNTQINRVKNEVRRLKSLDQTLGVNSEKTDYSMLVNETTDETSFNPVFNSTFANGMRPPYSR